MSDTFIDDPSDLHTLRSGVFPWSRSLGEEFIKRTADCKADTVIDLCSGTGHLGVTVAESIGAKRVILLEINPISCKIARDIWHDYVGKEIFVIQADILKPPLFHSTDSVVVANPPHAPLPDSFRAWRNVYGGKDGLLFVRAIFHWLLEHRERVSFFISAYLLSRKSEISARDVLSALRTADPGVRNIYHYQKPVWQWRGVSEENNPGSSEQVFASYLSYFEENERTVFLKFLKNRPYTHHILIEGEMNTSISRFGQLDFVL